MLIGDTLNNNNNNNNNNNTNCLKMHLCLNNIYLKNNFLYNSSDRNENTN